MTGRLVRFFLARGAEVLLAIGLVLAFFLVFMALLSFAIPRGTSLGDLMRSGQPAPEAGGRTGEGGDIEQDEVGDGRQAVAILSSIRRDVKDKPADAIAWTPSSPGMTLGDYHAVQTSDRSRATIAFSEGSEMALEENTLIIVKSAGRLASGGRRRASLIVVDGELRGAIAVSRDAPGGVEIETATKSASLRSEAAPGRPAEFAVRVNEDASSTITVFQGAAEVSSERGSVVMAPNHAITIDKTGVLGPSREIPPPPPLLEPEQGLRRTFRTSRSSMHLAWQGQGPADAYRLTVARDSAFRDIVTSEVLATPESTVGNLKEGVYYWRVSTHRGDLEGPRSAARQFRMVRNLKEPHLTVNFPDRVVNRAQVVLAGSADPGTRVIINNEEITVSSSGRFSHALTLQRGVNVVVVEAIDAAGNVAYRSQPIDARY